MLFGGEKGCLSNIKNYIENKVNLKKRHVKITHLGAKECVTGSCHLIETYPGSADSVNILVDCGKAYGNDPEPAFDQFPVPPARINYLN